MQKITYYECKVNGHTSRFSELEDAMQVGEEVYEVMYIIFDSAEEYRSGHNYSKQDKYVNRIA